MCQIDVAPSVALVCSSCKKSAESASARYCCHCGCLLVAAEPSITPTKWKAKKVIRSKNQFRGRITVEPLLMWDDYDFSYHSCDRFNWHLTMNKSPFVRHGGAYWAQIDEYLFNVILCNAWVNFMDGNWQLWQQKECTLGEHDYQMFLEMLLSQLLEFLTQ